MKGKKKTACHGPEVAAQRLSGSSVGNRESLSQQFKLGAGRVKGGTKHPPGRDTEPTLTEQGGVRQATGKDGAGECEALAEHPH